MKVITLGDKEYKLMETLFDINDERFIVFKQYLLQTIERIDKPLFLDTYSRYVAYIDQGKHSRAYLEWENYKKAIQLKEMNYDAMSICFALLTLEEGEDQRQHSKEMQLKKLEHMRAYITRGFVEETVENFMQASPKTFGAYLAVLEILKPEIKAELLKE